MVIKEERAIRKNVHFLLGNGRSLMYLKHNYFSCNVRIISL